MKKKRIKIDLSTYSIPAWGGKESVKDLDQVRHTRSTFYIGDLKWEKMHEILREHDIEPHRVYNQGIYGSAMTNMMDAIRHGDISVDYFEPGLTENEEEYRLYWLNEGVKKGDFYKVLSWMTRDGLLQLAEDFTDIEDPGDLPTLAELDQPSLFGELYDLFYDGLVPPEAIGIYG